jgi:hypothetical protein
MWDPSKLARSSAARTQIQRQSNADEANTWLDVFLDRRVVNLAVSFERVKRFGGAEGCQGRTCKQRCSDDGLDIQGPLGHHDEAIAYILTFSRSMASQLRRISPFDLPLAHVFLHLRPSFLLQHT